MSSIGGKANWGSGKMGISDMRFGGSMEAEEMAKGLRCKHRHLDGQAVDDGKRRRGRWRRQNKEGLERRCLSQGAMMLNDFFFVFCC